MNTSREYYNNRKKLLKDGKYIIYEDDKVLVYQEGKGYDPYYKLWVFNKKSCEDRRVKNYRSIKFKDYWRNYIVKGECPDGFTFVLGEDFV